MADRDPLGSGYFNGLAEKLGPSVVRHALKLARPDLSAGIFARIKLMTRELVATGRIESCVLSRESKAMRWLVELR
jgi:hypothetical protein